MSYAEAARASQREPAAPLPSQPKIPEFPSLIEATRIKPNKDGSKQVLKPSPIAPPKAKSKHTAQKQQEHRRRLKQKKDEDDFEVLDKAIQECVRQPPKYNTELYERRTDLMPPSIQIFNIFIMFYAPNVREHREMNDTLGMLCTSMNNERKKAIERAVLERFTDRIKNAEFWQRLETSCNLRGKRYASLRNAIVEGQYHMITSVPQNKDDDN